MMKAVLALSALALVAGGSLRPALAAHAGAPYSNVDHRNDAGNDTGDSQVDQLNAAQLDSNYYASRGMPAPRAGAPMMPAR